MVFHWSLSDSKSPQVSTTFLNILADLNNAIVWMVSTRPLISKSSSPFINPLMAVPRAPITIGIIVLFMLHSFFQFPCKVQVLIILFVFFQFYSVINRDSKVRNSAGSLFLLLIFIRSGPLVEIRWSVCISKSHRNLCVSYETLLVDIRSSKYLNYTAHVSLYPSVAKSRWVSVSVCLCPPSLCLCPFFLDLFEWWIFGQNIFTCLQQLNSFQWYQLLCRVGDY